MQKYFVRDAGQENNLLTMCHHAADIFFLPANSNRNYSGINGLRTGRRNGYNPGKIERAHTCSRSPCWNSKVYATLLIYLQFKVAGKPISNSNRFTQLLCKRNEKTGRQRKSLTLSHFSELSLLQNFLQVGKSNRNSPNNAGQGILGLSRFTFPQLINAY